MSKTPQARDPFEPEPHDVQVKTNYLKNLHGKSYKVTNPEYDKLFDEYMDISEMLTTFRHIEAFTKNGFNADPAIIRAKREFPTAFRDVWPGQPIDGFEAVGLSGIGVDMKKLPEDAQQVVRHYQKKFEKIKRDENIAAGKKLGALRKIQAISHKI